MLRHVGPLLPLAFVALLTLPVAEAEARRRYTQRRRITWSTRRRSTLRLVGTSEVLLSGRVEVYHNGQWGTVCDDAFGSYDAAVVCRQLGASGGTAIPNYGGGAGPIWMDNLGCTGSESLLSSCTFRGWGVHSCSHSEDVGVRCSYQTSGRRRVRLVGSTYRGRVELMYWDEWGTVCDDGFDNNDAAVVCRELGFSGGIAIPTYGGGTGAILMDDVACSGSEGSLQDCGHLGYGNNNCGHSEDVGVECSAAGADTRRRYTQRRRITWEIRRRSTLRLVGTSEALLSGRVEVYHNSQWGTVCDNAFGSNDAAVVCRQLGVSGGTAVPNYGGGAGPIWMDNLGCTGSESNLSSCTFRGWGVHSCSHSEDVGVRCSWQTSGRRRVRLNGSSYRGRVELMYIDEWGTVCDDAFDNNDAAVVCRELGFSGGIAIPSYGGGTGAIWMDDVACSGSEGSLKDCGHRGYGSNDCSHSQDVGVECTALTDAVEDAVDWPMILAITGCSCLPVLLIVYYVRFARKYRKDKTPSTMPEDVKDVVPSVLVLDVEAAEAPGPMLLGRCQAQAYCTISGCTRANAAGYNTCCRTCASTNGAAHGPCCEQRHRAAQARAEQEHLQRLQTEAKECAAAVDRSSLQLAKAQAALADGSGDEEEVRCAMELLKEAKDAKTRADAELAELQKVEDEESSAVVTTLPTEMPPYWADLATLEHGWRAYPVDAKVLQTIKEIFIVRRPGELQKGRDAGSYSRPYSKLSVHCAWRIEHNTAWGTFAATRNKLLGQMNQLRNNFIVLPPWQSKMDAASRSLPGERFLKEVGERYLLHGTKPENVLDIIHGGFSEKHASRRSMYGEGNYCADEPEKIDQYTLPDKGQKGLEELHNHLYPPGGNAHPGEDVFYCFIVRTACGACFQSEGLDKNLLKDAKTEKDVYLTDERRKLSRIEGSSPSISYHTLVMHPSTVRTGGNVERFREIILFDGNGMYPEYLLAYRRLE